jgi:hypothetical protein
MPGFMPGINALKRESGQRRGWPGRRREDALLPDHDALKRFIVTHPDLVNSALNNGGVSFRDLLSVCLDI